MNADDWINALLALVVYFSVLALVDPQAPTPTASPDQGEKRHVTSH